MESASNRLESQLGLAVRRYLTEPAAPAMADLSSGLEYLLGWKWQERGLTPPLEFDGLGHHLITLNPPDGLHVIGMMYEIESQTVDWFSADLHLVHGTGRLESYTLRYGVKGLELPTSGVDRLNFERHLEAAQSGEWKHIFTKENANRSGSSP
jgi:hypothetical protein